MSFLRVIFMLKGLFMGLAQLFHENKPQKRDDDCLKRLHGLMSFLSLVWSIGHMYYNPGHEDKDLHLLVMFIWKIFSIVAHMPFMEVFEHQGNDITKLSSCSFFCTIVISLITMSYHRFDALKTI